MTLVLVVVWCGGDGGGGGGGTNNGVNEYYILWMNLTKKNNYKFLWREYEKIVKVRACERCSKLK